MRADEAASLATRSAKDRSLTPTNLADRWRREAAEVDLVVGPGLDAAVRSNRPSIEDDGSSWDALVARLVDEEGGLCAARPASARPTS